MPPAEPDTTGFGRAATGGGLAAECVEEPPLWCVVDFAFPLACVVEWSLLVAWWSLDEVFGLLVAALALVFVAEEVDRSLGFAGFVTLVVSAAGALVTVVAAVDGVVVLDVPVAVWADLLAPHPLRAGASRTASATAPERRVTRLEAQCSGRGTDRKRDIRLILRGPSADVNRVTGPSDAMSPDRAMRRASSTGVSGPGDRRARGFKWMGAADKEVRESLQRGSDGDLARTAVELRVGG
jgi:hypothetical protein